MLCACQPDVFDELVGEARTSDASAIGRQFDGSLRPAADAGDAPDAARGGAHDSGSSTADGSARPIDGGQDAAAARDAGDTLLDGGESPPCPQAEDAARVRISIADQGVLPTPSWIASRDGLGSAVLGERVAWLFTLAPGQNMVVWSSVEDVLASPPRLSDQEPFVSLLPAAASANGAPLGITSIVAAGSEALIFFASYFYFSPLDVGLARLAVDDVQAQVVRPVGELLPAIAKDADGGVPWHPVFTSGAVVDPSDAHLYLYACHANPEKPEELVGGALDAPCRVVRVPVQDAADGTRYRYWDGVAWVDDPLRASIVVSGVPGGWTVSFNRYLRKFVGIHSGPANNVILHHADRPEGPWQTLGTFETMIGGGPWGLTLYATEHPGLRDACHQILYVSYIRQFDVANDAGTPATVSETRLVRVALE